MIQLALKLKEDGRLFLLPSPESEFWYIITNKCTGGSMHGRKCIIFKYEILRQLGGKKHGPQKQVWMPELGSQTCICTGVEKSGLFLKSLSKR